MNRTKIEWTDYTWNPITGCLGPKGDGVRCHYCYAHKLAEGRLKNRYIAEGSPLCLPFDDPFIPRYWADKLLEPLSIKKPSKIFVCSMSDFCGPWVPRGIQNAVLDVVKKCPQHTFQFVTKHPEGLLTLSPWPENCWVMATATNREMAREAIAGLRLVTAKVRVLNLEPLLGYMPELNLEHIDLLIIGAQTGLKPIKPQTFWVNDLINQALQFNTPVFLKDNLNWWYEKKEWPRGAR